MSELNGASGFVMAPFKASPDCPLVLFQPTVVLKSEVPAESEPYELQWHEASYRAGYRQAFAQMHYMLNSGTLEKARMAPVPLATGMSAVYWAMPIMGPPAMSL